MLNGSLERDPSRKEEIIAIFQLFGIIRWDLKPNFTIGILDQILFTSVILKLENGTARRSLSHHD
jgi:hypothetical protein